jgi:GNAT superfamily N-acetyltransferase
VAEESLIARVCETNHDYLALGNERFEAAGASFIRNRSTPHRYNANHAGLIRADTPAAIDALFVRVEREFAEFSHRSFGIDPLTPPQFTARLAMEDGYAATDLLTLVLDGEVKAKPRDIEVREVVTEEDWQDYRGLDELWWRETSVSYLGEYSPSLHDEHMLNRRIKPDVRGWFACVDGVPRGFLSSWPGENGTGIIEDLFCHEAFRRRGLATALIVRAVADARERGAGPVVINADVHGQPRQIYATLGFRPLFVHQEYVRRPR